jgi:hypothetical protein
MKNSVIYNLLRYVSEAYIKRMRRLEHLVHIREKKTACRVLVGNPEGKRTVGRRARS